MDRGGAGLVGVDVGGQPLNSGGMEYIIQIEPDSLDSLANGQDIISDVPTFLRDARTYRVRIGKDVLPQQGPKAATPDQPTLPSPSSAVRAAHIGGPSFCRRGLAADRRRRVGIIIQISPDSLASLLDGHEIVSDVPNSMRDVRSCRIHLGQDPLPRKAINPHSRANRRWPSRKPPRPALS